MNEAWAGSVALSWSKLQKELRKTEEVSGKVGKYSRRVRYRTAIGAMRFLALLPGAPDSPMDISRARRSRARVSAASSAALFLGHHLELQAGGFEDLRETAKFRVAGFRKVPG